MYIVVIQTLVTGQSGRYSYYVKSVNDISSGHDKYLKLKTRTGACVRFNHDQVVFWSYTWKDPEDE